MSRTSLAAISLGLVASLLSACSLAPTYKAPATEEVTRYKEAGDWAPAQPADGQQRGPWWEVFGDPKLNDLEARLDAANPDLQAAVARFEQARAVARQDISKEFPTLGFGASATRARSSATAPLANLIGNVPVTSNDFLATLNLNWEIDLFGRLRNTAAAARAQAQGSEADTAAVALSLQAELASEYFSLRGDDTTISLLDGHHQGLRSRLRSHEQPLPGGDCGCHGRGPGRHTAAKRPRAARLGAPRSCTARTCDRRPARCDAFDVWARAGTTRQLRSRARQWLAFGAAATSPRCGARGAGRGGGECTDRRRARRVVPRFHTDGRGRLPEHLLFAVVQGAEPPVVSRPLRNASRCSISALARRRTNRRARATTKRSRITARPRSPPTRKLRTISRLCITSPTR